MRTVVVIKHVSNQEIATVIVHPGPIVTVEGIGPGISVHMADEETSSIVESPAYRRLVAPLCRDAWHQKSASAITREPECPSCHAGPFV